MTLRIRGKRQRCPIAEKHSSYTTTWGTIAERRARGWFFWERLRCKSTELTLLSADFVAPLLAQRVTMLISTVDELARLTKQVLYIVRREAVCRRLISVPGVGPITALAFRATIDRPDRFRRSRDVGAHLGLTPARYQSGETDIQGKVSRCGDELARTALYEAAHTLLVRSKKWSSLRAWGMRIAKHRGMARLPANSP